MRGREYRIGPGASTLLLILIVLMLTTLGMLSYLSARADAKLSARVRDMTEAYYAADAAAQKRLSEIDSILANVRAESADDAEYFAKLKQALPNWSDLSDGEVTFSQNAGGERSIAVRLTVLGIGKEARYKIKSYALVDAMDWEPEQPNLIHE